MTMRKSFLLVAVAVLCMIVFSFATGCDTFQRSLDGGGDNGDGDNGGGGADVALGTMRVVQPGDTWNYALTGTFVADAGGVTPITPGDASLVYSQNTIALDGVQDAHKLTFEGPIQHATADYVEHIALVFTQAADGMVTFYGLTPSDQFGPEAFDTPIPLPDITNLNAAADMDVTRTMPSLGDFDLTTSFVGVENVTVGGVTYECFRVDGHPDLGGYGYDFTMWINPQTGGMVRWTSSHPDYLGTSNVTLELQSTNFAI